MSRVITVKSPTCLVWMAAQHTASPHDPPPHLAIQGCHRAGRGRETGPQMLPVKPASQDLVLFKPWGLLCLPTATHPQCQPPSGSSLLGAGVGGLVLCLIGGSAASLASVHKLPVKTPFQSCSDGKCFQPFFECPGGRVRMGAQPLTENR